MEEDEKMLDEIVVVGYGAMKKRDLSGSVTQVKTDEILVGNPSSSINQALQGRIAGVVINQNDGAPGAGVNMQIRGTNSFSSNTQPLYVVDGIPLKFRKLPEVQKIQMGVLKLREMRWHLSIPMILHLLRY